MGKTFEQPSKVLTVRIQIGFVQIGIVSVNAIETITRTISTINNGNWDTNRDRDLSENREGSGTWTRIESEAATGVDRNIDQCWIRAVESLAVTRKSVGSTWERPRSRSFRCCFSSSD
ncbi:hypothetical protein EVAR_5226_1 [Eumeta japonica]|uniref:Uncharacterized protein n=1 Tax=Eumeta variegata TaxID=151549 RepID=A0A4C1V3B5_EUMVA|nr:hypothetical protein EVAR_5226_1 [Eumeta japonica]